MTFGILSGLIVWFASVFAIFFLGGGESWLITMWVAWAVIIISIEVRLAIKDS